MSLTYTAPPASPTLDTGNSLYGNILSMIVIDPSQNIVELKAAGGTFSYQGGGSHSFVADGGGYKLRCSGGTYLREAGLSGLGALTFYTMMAGVAMTTMSNAYAGVIEINKGDESGNVLALAKNSSNSAVPLQVYGATTVGLTGASALIPNVLVGRGYSVVGITMQASNSLYGYIDGTADTGNVGAMTALASTTSNIDIFGSTSSEGDFYWFLLLNTQLNSTQMSSIASNPWQLLLPASGGIITQASQSGGMQELSGGMSE